MADTVTLDVSVIIPVYNTVDYLRPCLDSLVGQTIGHDRFEVVAVDDGSTDGSGELLDEYAARHPQVFRVVHQANSGGPAGPCNVGLDHARGRFVFFLGSDDYLSLDALERLVDRADRWDADVVVPVAEGVNGRHISQRLFKREVADLPFPGELLSYSLSNTKLFRRSLVEEQALRYPLDLKVGSDQPFAVAAMLAARRIGVIGGPTAYFGVKRLDEGNITYVSDWQTRLTNLSAVVEHLCDLIAPGADRDALLVRHFSWEFDKLLTRDLPLLADGEDRELVDALRGLAQRFLTDGVLRLLSPPRRVRWHHLRAGDVEALRASVDLDLDSAPVLIEPGGVFLELPGFRAGLPDDLFALRQNLARWLAEIDRGASLAVDGSQVVLTARTTMVAPASAPCLRLALSPVRDDGDPRGAVDAPRSEGTRVLAAAPVTITAEGDVHAALDLTPYVEQGGGRAGLRLRLVTDDRIVDRPLRLPVAAASTVAAPSRRGAVRVTSVVDDRVLVEVDVETTFAGRILGRLRR